MERTTLSRGSESLHQQGAPCVPPRATGESAAALLAAPRPLRAPGFAEVFPGDGGWVAHARRARRAGGGAARVWGPPLHGAAAAARGRLVGMEHIRTTKVGARRPLAAEGPAGRAAWAGFPSGVRRRGPAVSPEGPAASLPSQSPAPPHFPWGGGFRRRFKLGGL